MKCKKYNKSILFLLLIFVAIICISIGYCVMDGINLSIEGTAETESLKILYIDSIEQDNTSSTAGASYVSYDTDKTFLQISNITLPKENITEDTNITILVHLNNLSDITYKFKSVSYLTAEDIGSFSSLKELNSNPNIIIDETSYQDYIDSIIDANSIDGMGTLTIPISFKYADISNITDNTLNVSIKLNFEQHDKQRYNLKTGRDFYNVLSAHYEDATKIIFCAKSEVPTNSTYIGEAGLTDGEIKAYWNSDGTIYIAAETKFSIINFNEDSGYMFSNGEKTTAFKNVTSISITRGVTIDTSSVQHFEEMFKGCVKLSESSLQNFINHFDTSSATNMCAMFSAIESVTELDLSHFKTDNVTDMSWMFENNPNLIDINFGSTFSTDSVKGNLENEGFAGMFIKCTNLKVLNLTSFNTENVRSMWQMFKNCTSLEKIYVSDKFVTNNLNTSTSNNFYTSDLFLNCTNLSGDQGTTFANSQITNSTYAHFDEGTNNPGYFSKIKNYTITINTNGGTFAEGGNEKTYTDTARVKTRFTDIPIKEGYYFLGWAESKDEKAPQYHSNTTTIFTKDTTLYALWGERMTVTLKTGKNIFSVISNYKAEAEQVIFAYKEDIPKEVINLGNIESDNSGKIEACYDATNKTIYFALTDSSYDTIVFNADSSHMFSMGNTEDTAFNKLKTIAVDDKLTIDTSQVTSFAEIFKYNTSLTQESIQAFINKFDTKNVTNMCAMFEYLNIDAIDISHFNTANVTDISWLFHGSSIININFGSNFNTSNVRKFDGMFQDMKKITTLDISLIKVSKGATINYMFGKCPNLKTIYVSEDNGFENAGAGDRVFEGDTSLVGGSGDNETKFTSNQVSKSYARISTQDNPGYFTSANEK